MKRMLARRILIPLSAAVLLLTTVLAAAQTVGTWTRAAPFPEPSEELYGIAVNNRIYVFGGYANRAPKGLVFEYDAAADRWTRKKNMPLPAHHTALATLN